MRRATLGAGGLALCLAACGDGDGAGNRAADGGTGGAASTNTGGGSNTGGGTSNAGGAANTGGRPANAGGTPIGGASSGGNSSAGGAAAAGGTTGGGGSSGAPGTGGQPGAGGAPGDAGGGPCGAIATFEDGRAPSRELHVATNGSAQGDGSPGSPFATIQQAASGATPGTAIVIHAGAYAGGAFLSGLAGTVDAPIWLGGAPGEARPVISGGADAFHLVRPRYLVVHNLEVSNTTSNGINCDDGSQYDDPDAARFVVFRGLDIHDVGAGGNEDCLKLSGLNDFWVLDSSFARCGGASSGSGIDHVGCHNGVIARSQFTDLSGNGVQAKGGSENIEIRQNRFLRAGERALNLGGSTGTEFFRPPLSTTAPNAEARNIRAFANVIEGGPSAVAFVGCVDCLAAHNTIVVPTIWVARILQETSTGGGFTFLESQGGRFVNNAIVVDGNLRTHVNVGGGTLPNTFVFQNNLWFNQDDPGSSTPALPVTETGGVVGQNPGFPGNGDYSIAASSPAAGAGTGVTEALSDFNGNCWASPPTIGAFEAE